MTNTRMVKRDYYEMLSVEKNTLAGEIKRAYRKRAIRFHPGRNPGDKQTEENFKEAAEAYDVLSDPQKHQRCGQFGYAGIDGASQGDGFGDGMSIEDIFSQFGDIFGRHFGGFDGFGGSNGSRGGRRVNRGSDLRMKVKLNLKKIVNGVEKKIKVKKYVPCSHCHGNGAEGSEGVKTCNTCKGSGVVTRITDTILGQTQTQATCPTYGGEGKIVVKKCTGCNGEGVVRNDEIIMVGIPTGVAEGIQLSMNGKGSTARHDEINGDLLILIEEKPRPKLIRDENDLLYNLLLSVPQAALGATVEVPTINGEAKLRVEPGTRPDEVLRLRNKGLSSINDYGMGDLLVNVSVYIPETLSSTEEETLNGLESSPNFRPSKTIKEKIFSKFKHFFG